MVLLLFDSSSLFKHAVVDSDCLYCQSLRVMDYSFYSLTDQLSQNLESPAGLKQLNLSNNQLQSKFQSSFEYLSLTNLCSLNLSNNKNIHST